MTGKTKHGIWFHIRKMIQANMQEVLEISELSFADSWTLDLLDRRDRVRLVAILGDQYGEKIVGFLIYQIRKTDLYPLNFAIHPDWRRMGAGTQLITKLIGQLSYNHRSHITVEVRETNKIALQFFKHQQFWATGILRGFYKDPDEDAIEMEYRRDGIYVPKCSTKPKNRISQYDQEGIF